MRMRIALALLALVASFTAAHAAEIVVQNDTVPPGQPLEGIFIVQAPGGLTREGIRLGARLTVPVSGNLVGVQIAWGSKLGGAAPYQETAVRISTDLNPGPFGFPGALLVTVNSPVLIDGALNEFRYLDPGTNLAPLSVPVVAGATYFIDLEFAQDIVMPNPVPPVFTLDTSHIPSILFDTDPNFNISKSLIFGPSQANLGFLPTGLVLSNSDGDLAIRAIVNPVPEPSSLALIGLSAIGLAGHAGRVRRRKAS